MRSSILKISLCLLGTLFKFTAESQILKPAAGPKGVYGYKNSQTGELVIPFQFDIAQPFIHGFAYVAKDSVGSFIDQTGHTVASGFVYGLSSFSERLAAVRMAVGDEYKYGYIDTTGKLVIAPLFDDALPFSSGLALVSIDQRLYYINPAGEMIIDIDPSAAHPFSETLAPVQNKEKTLWGCIDTTGKLVIDYRYNKVGFFSQGIAAVRIGEHWGFITDRGAQLVPCHHKWVGSFSENRAAVRYNHLTGYVDRNGKLVIPMEYTAASTFENGLSCAQKNNKWGYIDTWGKVVIRFQFDNATPFSDGLACVSKNGRYSYIDHTGKTVIKCNHRYAFPFCNGLACVGDGHKYGFIDVDGNLVIPMEYDQHTSFDVRGLAKVRKGGEKCFINKRGEKVTISENIRADNDGVINAEDVDVSPRFQGGDAIAFARWVGSKITYSRGAKEIGMQGTVRMTFCIDADGSLTDIEVLQSVYPDLDKEAIRVVSSSPKWTPGLHDGKPVKVRYSFPVIFGIK